MLRIMYVRPIVLIFCATGLVQGQLSSGTGLVGLGRTLFQPTCGYACVSSLWSLPLLCSSQVGTYNFSTPECHAANDAYLTSLALCFWDYCIGHDNNPLETAPLDIENCWDKIAGDGTPVKEWQDYFFLANLTRVQGFSVIGQPVMPSVLNDTWRVSGYGFDSSWASLMAYAAQEQYHAFLGTLMVTLVVGFCVLLGLVQLKNRFAPRVYFFDQLSYAMLDRLFLTPALFGSLRSEKLRWSLGYLPQRRTAIVLVIYTLINVILCTAPYPVDIEGNSWYVSYDTAWKGSCANRLGVLSLANIALAIMFSGRNSVIAYITRLSHEELLTFHRWSSRVAVLQGVIHAAIYLGSTDRLGTDFFTGAGAYHYLGQDNQYWEAGIVAFSFLLAIVAFSTLPIRTYWYEAFVSIHVRFVMVALLSLYYHLYLRFSGAYGYEIWLWIAAAVWAFDRAARIGRLMWLNSGRTPSSILASKVELLPGNQFIKITVWPSNSWRISPGQYCFLHFPRTPFFFESHPFYIASWSTGLNLQSEHDMEILVPGYVSPFNRNSDVFLQALETNSISRERLPSYHADAAPPLVNVRDRFSISFIIRPRSGMTRRIYSRLLSPNALNIPVLVEGPYGRMLNAVEEADEIIAIAGGIGITAILCYINAYVSSFPKSPGTYGCLKGTRMRARRLRVLWTVRESSLVEAFNSQLPQDEILTQRNVGITISCKQNGGGRMDFNQILDSELSGTERLREKAVIVCGPAKMADEIRSCVVKLKRYSHARVTLVEESFTY